MNKKDVPQIPIETILSTIGYLLKTGIGEEFSLEIYQRENTLRDDTDKVSITLDFNVPHENLRYNEKSA